MKKDKLYRMRVTRNGNEAKVRRWCRYTGLGPDSNLGVMNSCVDALEQAILERCFFIEVDDHFEQVLKVRSDAFEGVDELRNFRNVVVSHVSDVATVASLRQVVAEYHGAKRRTYERAYKSLMESKLTVVDRLLKMFTKFEKAVVTKAARVINPPHARYGLKLGKFLKKNEHNFFQAINLASGSISTHTVIKGLDVYQSAEVLLAKFRRFRKPVAIGLDAKKFDAHVTCEALKYEHLYYTMVFSSKLLRTMLEWQLNSEAVGYVHDGKVEVSFPGRRCSGDLNTSLGNCILMCAMVHAYCAEVQVEYELGNNGDDCVVIMEARDEVKFRSRLTKWFEDRGFRMEVEPTVDEFEKIEFCQSHPVFDGSRWRMVRNPITCMQKDPICLKSITTSKALNKWRGAVGRGGLSLASGIPVMQAFYACMQRNTRTCSRRYFENVVAVGTSLLERGAQLSAVEKPIFSPARASFAVAFGILPSHQIALENYYNNLTLLDEMSEVPAQPIPLVVEAPSIIITNI